MAKFVGRFGDVLYNGQEPCRCCGATYVHNDISVRNPGFLLVNIEEAPIYKDQELSKNIVEDCHQVVTKNGTFILKVKRYK